MTTCNITLILTYSLQSNSISSICRVVKVDADDFFTAWPYVCQNVNIDCNVVVSSSFEHSKSTRTYGNRRVTAATSLPVGMTIVCELSRNNFNNRELRCVCNLIAASNLIQLHYSSFDSVILCIIVAPLNYYRQYRWASWSRHSHLRPHIDRHLQAALADAEMKNMQKIDYERVAAFDQRKHIERILKTLYQLHDTDSR